MKIGILTHYFKSPNYGGNLQAYALVRFLREIGFDAEQICYDIFFKRKKRKASRNGLVATVIKVPRKITNYILRKTIWASRISFVERKQKERISCILEFNQNVIEHGNIVYDYDNIVNANDCYDVFITGSDQVWHPNNFCPAYLLTFASKEKKKISYAASIAKSPLTKEELNCILSSISDYKAVSLREQDSALALCSCYDKPINVVVDPVFLLSKDHWNSMAKSYLIDSPYLLTYFLGDNLEARKIAKKFAKYKKVKLVAIPYLNGRYRRCDWNYGDEQIFSAGPEHFLSLIKNASYVFTDSFHAAAFSLIFDKNFFVFPRDSKKTQMNRILSLLELSNCLGLVSTKYSSIDENVIDDAFEKKRIDMEKIESQTELSKQFLLKALAN